MTTNTTPARVNEALAAAVAEQVAAAGVKVARLLAEAQQAAEREANEHLAEQFPGITFDVKLHNAALVRPGTATFGRGRGVIGGGTVTAGGADLKITAFEPTDKLVTYVELFPKQGRPTLGHFAEPDKTVQA